MKFPKIVVVGWEDAASKDGWHSEEEAKEKLDQKALCLSVGFLVGENRTGILLADSCPDALSSNLSADKDSHWGSVLKLPKGMVHAIWEVKLLVKRDHAKEVWFPVKLPRL